LQFPEAYRNAHLRRCNAVRHCFGNGTPFSPYSPSSAKILAIEYSPRPATAPYADH
jgi:hypothetical protein